MICAFVPAYVDCWLSHENKIPWEKQTLVGFLKIPWDFTPLTNSCAKVLLYFWFDKTFLVAVIYYLKYICPILKRCTHINLELDVIHTSATVTHAILLYSDDN